MAVDAKQFQGMFTTPAQIRSNRISDIMAQQQSLAGLGGSMSGLLGQVAGAGGIAGQMLAEGLAGATGLQTQEERQAQVVQDAFRASNSNDLNKMRAARKRLQDSGAPAQAIMMIDQQIAAKEQQISATASALREEQRQNELLQLKKDEVELERLKVDADKILNSTVAGYDMTTKDGQNAAINALMKIGTKDSITLAARLKNAFKKNEGTMMADISAIAAQYTNGDMDKAKDIYLKLKRDNPLLGATSERLNTEYEKSITTRNRIDTANKALETLASGEVILGSFATPRQGAEKLVEALFGLDSDGAVARTEQLMARVKRLGGEALASGMFGSGTAISDRDLATAMAIAGGEQSLTKEGMEAIIKANMAIDILELDRYNKNLENIGEGFWNQSYFSKDSYRVEVPEAFTPPFSISRATNKAQNSAGETIYEYNGDWYKADGTKYTQ